MILYRSFGVCSRASLIAASFASAPELQKNAWPPKLRSRKQLGPAALRFHVPGVGHVDQLGHLLLHRLDDRGGQWPSRLQPQPGKKSRYRRPWSSHTYEPSPRTSATGNRV